ncbi:hypothetical protein C8R46DRAFT_548235 [Mycena filopes]|nr:hypothetical protein C8R46DRAFT_548235 [Mycena filopes]
MHEFLWIAKRLDSKLTNTLLPSAVWSFGIILKILLHVQETFTEIELLQARYRDVLDVEIDRILNATIGRIVTEMNGTVCEMILDNSEIAIPLAWNTSSLGSELAGGLDGELARVQDALNRLPWWDTWDLYHLTGISRIGVLHRAYLKFFEEEGRILRSLADSSTLIHENLVDINNYCVWYTTDDYVQLMHTNAAKIGDVTAAAIARDIETLKNRIELAVEVGKTPQVPGWPPQRRAARTLFRTY